MNTATLSKILLLAAGMALAGAASAQSTWNLSTSSCDPDGLNPGAAGCTVGGVTATVTAWGNSGSGGTFVAAKITDQAGSGIGATSKWSGTTEISSDGKNHAIDNVGGSGNLGAVTELVLVQFSSAVELSGLAINWYSGDADISVLRYTGSTAPTMTALTTSNYATKGWAMVASSDVDPVNTMSFAGGGYSSWWLISSYFGANNVNAADRSGKLTVGDDYFKLLSFAGVAQTPPGRDVPEPASLALAGLALAGVWGAQRRRTRRG